MCGRCLRVLLLLVVEVVEVEVRGEIVRVVLDWAYEN